MSPELDRLIERLRGTADADGQLDPRRADPILAEIADLGDPDCVGPLLSLLRDDAARHEAMFSMIHAAESFADEPYLRRLAAALPDLARRAPVWAEALHFRVLNSPPTAAEYTRLVLGLDDGERAAVVATLNALAARSPEFTDRCRPILAACGRPPRTS